MTEAVDEFGIDEWAAEDVTPDQKRDWPAWTPLWHDLIFGEVSSRAVHLYAVLGRFSGEDGAWPKRKTLAAAVGCSLDSLDRAKDELLVAGWITVIGQIRDSDGGQTSNLYRLHQESKTAVPRPQKRGGGEPQNRGTKKDNQSRTTNPPTPQSAAAEPGQEQRTYPSGPVRTAEQLAELDGRSQPRVPLEKITALKEQLRPPREESA